MARRPVRRRSVETSRTDEKPKIDLWLERIERIVRIVGPIAALGYWFFNP